MKLTIKYIIAAFFACGICIGYSCSDKPASEPEPETQDSIRKGVVPDPLPDLDPDPDSFFSEITAVWDLKGSDWLYYNAADKVWMAGGEDPEYRGTIMGHANSRLLFAYGFWEDEFGFMAEVDASNNVTIPIDPILNPVARVITSSSAYILFITLFDFDTGYFLSIGNALEVNVSDDRKVMSIDPVEREFQDNDGVTVKAKYDYFALIGINESTGNFTRFSNWTFPLTPSFINVSNTRSQTYDVGYDRSIGIPKLKNASVRIDGTNKVSDVVYADEIVSIEYMWTF